MTNYQNAIPILDSHSHNEYLSKTSHRRIYIEIFHQEMATSDFQKSELRIPGIRTVKFKPETLTRI